MAIQELQGILDNINNTLKSYKGKIRSIETGGVWRGSFNTVGDIPATLEAGDALFRDLDINDLITIIEAAEGGRTGVATYRYTAEISLGYSKSNFAFSHWASVDYSDELSALNTQITNVKNILEASKIEELDVDLTDIYTRFKELERQFETLQGTGGGDFQSKSSALSIGNASGGWTLLAALGAQALKNAVKTILDDDFMYEWESLN